MNSTMKQRLGYLEDSSRSLENRINEVEKLNQLPQAPLKYQLVFNQTRNSKQIEEYMLKVFGKKEFKLSNSLFCTPDTTDDKGNVIGLEALKFDNGVVKYYNLARDSVINSKSPTEGRGSYLITGLNITLTVTMKDSEVLIYNFQISQLSKDKSRVTGIELSPTQKWTIRDCRRYGISYSR